MTITAILDRIDTLETRAAYWWRQLADPLIAETLTERAADQAEAHYHAIMTEVDRLEDQADAIIRERYPEA